MKGRVASMVYTSTQKHNKHQSNPENSDKILNTAKTAESVKVGRKQPAEGPPRINKITFTLPEIKPMLTQPIEF